MNKRLITLISDVGLGEIMSQVGSADETVTIGIIGPRYVGERSSTVHLSIPVGMNYSKLAQILGAGGLTRHLTYDVNHKSGFEGMRTEDTVTPGYYSPEGMDFHDYKRLMVEYTRFQEAIDQQAGR